MTTQSNFARKLVRRIGIGLVTIGLVTFNPLILFLGILFIFIGNFV